MPLHVTVHWAMTCSRSCSSWPQGELWAGERAGIPVPVLPSTRSPAWRALPCLLSVLPPVQHFLRIFDVVKATWCVGACRQGWLDRQAGQADAVPCRPSPSDGCCCLPLPLLRHSGSSSVTAVGFIQAYMICACRDRMRMHACRMPLRYKPASTTLLAGGHMVGKYRSA